MQETPIHLNFTVNGITRAVNTPPERRLLDILREDLGLTGAKEGCGVGECGACTVLLDGEPVNACMVQAFQVEGRQVVTVEGLGTPEAPSPVQQAFLAATSVQCGFCTPGMVVAVTDMLQRQPAITRQEARRHLSGNICRCTGYSQILDAVERVQHGQVDPPADTDGVGRSVVRVDGLDKVTGTCRYTADLPWPAACLHGATVRSKVPHGRPLAIHSEDALAVPGVVRVLTWQDVPGELHYGNAVDDQPVLVKDHIRFWGEALAVVLAEDPAAAREGAARVRVEVEPLPVVSDPSQALAPGAPLVHDSGNLLVHQKLRKGDVDAAMASAFRLVHRRYTTPSQEHLCLEPEVALVLPEADGSLTVKAPSQNVFFDRHHICRTLGLDRRLVRVIQQPTGAAFGSREDIYAQIHTALGALLTGRPVRMVWTREETQVVTTKRHPATVDITAAMDEDGSITALEIDVLADTGAYASWAPNIARKALVHAAGPYALPNVAVDVRMVYTNNGVSGAFRGFGAPQVVFACESFMDELAAISGQDPLALRRRHHLAVGKQTATGQTITGSCGLAECVDRAVAAADEQLAALPPPPAYVARGMGLSNIFYGIGYGNAIRDIGSAIVEFIPGGRFQVRCGAIDYGQGALTVFTQIAAEVLGVSRARLEILTGDSEETPDSGSTVASRQTYVSGEAVRQACERLRSELLDFAAGHFQLAREALILADGGLFAGAEGICSLETLQGACETGGLKLRRQARFKASTTRLDLETGQGDAYWPYAFAAQVAIVDVDRRTGRVEVRAVVAAHDVGKAINPAMVRGQIAGGVAQGLGFALLEDHRLKDGIPLTLNLDTYRVPGAADVPDVVAILVEDPEPSGPFGAKGVGEPVLVAIAPAIANAVANATGVRIRDLPLTPERVRAALYPPAVVVPEGA